MTLRVVLSNDKTFTVRAGERTIGRLRYQRLIVLEMTLRVVLSNNKKPLLFERERELPR